MDSNLSHSQTLRIETLSPLHIGNGRELVRDYDYIAHRGKIWVLDTDRLAEYLLDNVPKQFERMVRGISPRDLLSEAEMEPDNPIFSYVLSGTSAGGGGQHPIRQFIKDAWAKPYLPGSSIKGAFRTALIWAIYKLRNRAPDFAKIGGGRSFAGQGLERDVVGRNPNFDLLRALRIGDSEVDKASVSLQVGSADVYPPGSKQQRGVQIDLEYVREGRQFVCRFQQDRYLSTSPAVDILDWSKKSRWLDYIMGFARDISALRIQQELAYCRDKDELRSVRAFYTRLKDLHGTLADHECLLQIGWGAGWSSKTLNDLLATDPVAFARVVRDKKLRGSRSQSYQAGMPFPTSRRFLRLNEQVLRPMGWVKMSLGEGIYG